MRTNDVSFSREMGSIVGDVSVHRSLLRDSEPSFLPTLLGALPFTGEKVLNWVTVCDSIVARAYESAQ